MKRFRDAAVFLFFFVGIAIVIVCSLFNFYLSPVSNKKINQEFVIKDGGEINKIASSLYKKKLIRNPKVFTIYLKMIGVKKLNKGKYDLNSSMTSREIVHYLSN